MRKTVAELVRDAIEFDRVGMVNTSKYVAYNLREDINTTEAYLNSKHISGPKDSMGRDKPFFNIVTSARNILYRATEIKRKDIKIRATKEEDEIEAFIATILFHEWMKKIKFADYLSQWGLTLASHGSAITKKVEQDGELKLKVMDWNNIIVDPIDFENNIKIEKLYFTPAQLKAKKEYDQAIVDDLLLNLTNRKTAEGNTKDIKFNYIELYEVHGELEEANLTGKEEDTDYVQQMHILSFQAKKDGSFDEFELFKGREAEDPYKIAHLIKTDGTTYAGGAVKNLFQAQWMTNHQVKQIKDQLDLASKIIFQTSDTAFAGENVLTSIENGDILKHAPNAPLTRLDGAPNIEGMESFQMTWQKNAAEINGISEAMQGEAPKAGTAWRQVQATLQENHSLFELMKDNKGLALIDLMTDYVLPFFKKQLNHSKPVSSILEEWQIKQIDSRYIPNEITRRVNQKKKATILSGRIYDPESEVQDSAQAEQDIRSKLTGNQRFLNPSEVDNKTWKEVFKNSEWELDLDVTGESKDIQGTLATLTTVLQTLATNPGVLQDPNIKMIFGRILSLSGAISPLEFQVSQPQQPQQPNAQPSPPGQVGGQAQPNLPMQQMQPA